MQCIRLINTLLMNHTMNETINYNEFYNDYKKQYSKECECRMSERCENVQWDSYADHHGLSVTTPEYIDQF